MHELTRRLWRDQDRHAGDRSRLFGAVARFSGGERALYPGSFVDVAASTAWPTVTYVDVDRRAARFFDDREGVSEIIVEGGGSPSAAVTFVHADYTADLPLEPASYDVLISLYAGFVSEWCTRYLRVGGTLLVNPSHGDVAMAALDERYVLGGVVISEAGTYRVRTDDLDAHLIPKRPTEVTVDFLHEHGRGIAYTTSPFAYLFDRIS